METDMLVGYGRTSTVTQEAGLEAQERDLKAAGVEKLFTEQVSSVAAREEFEAALDYVRNGDVLVVTKLDRLARSIRDLCNIVGPARCQGSVAPHPRHGLGHCHRQWEADAERAGLCGSVRT